MCDVQTGLHPLFLSTQGCWCTLAHLPKSVKHQCVSILIGRDVLTPISGAPASSCTIPATQPELQLAEGCSPAHSGSSRVCFNAEAFAHPDWWVLEHTCYQGFWISPCAWVYLPLDIICSGSQERWLTHLSTVNGTLRIVKCSLNWAGFFFFFFIPIVWVLFSYVLGEGACTERRQSRYDPEPIPGGGTAGWTLGSLGPTSRDSERREVSAIARWENGVLSRLRVL